MSALWEELTLLDLWLATASPISPCDQHRQTWLRKGKCQAVPRPVLRQCLGATLADRIRGDVQLRRLGLTAQDIGDANRPLSDFGVGSQVQDL